MVSNVADTNMAKIKKKNKGKIMEGKNSTKCMWTMNARFKVEWLGNFGDPDFLKL